jgi:hypothetical protein
VFACPRTGGRERVSRRVGELPPARYVSGADVDGIPAPPFGDPPLIRAPWEPPRSEARRGRLRAERGLQ